MSVYDARSCELGEGPLWHPERGALFWFDVLGRTLHSAARSWEFDEIVSAAGWVDRDHLLIASETGLIILNLETGDREPYLELEADKAQTRTNDGRADPWGGFWISTMGKGAEEGAGAIYRVYSGSIRPLYMGLTIPNAICFAPDRSTAYWTDTPTRQVMAQPLDGEGWPKGAPRVLVDLGPEGLNPDGAVTDATGNLWIAQWGAGRVACHAPDGSFLQAVEVGARQSSCPAFGGAELDRLFVTTAREGYGPDDLAADPLAGQVFEVAPGVRGLAEPRVRL